MARYLTATASVLAYRGLFNQEHNMNMMKDKYAIVTGGGTGIGFGIARRLLEEGAASVMIAGRREEVLQDAVERLSKLVPNAPVKYITCDVTDEEPVKAMVEAASDDNGELDVMVCNAGTGFPNPILEADVSGWKAMCDLNIIGTLLCTKHAGLELAPFKVRVNAIRPGFVPTEV
jgi:NAD(P)-dependent dehydrogenase (short-subunit alcohol dehydrogenase family)